MNGSWDEADRAYDRLCDEQGPTEQEIANLLTEDDKAEARERYAELERKDREAELADMEPESGHDTR